MVWYLYCILCVCYLVNFCSSVAVLSLWVHNSTISPWKNSLSLSLSLSRVSCFFYVYLTCTLVCHPIQIALCCPTALYIILLCSAENLSSHFLFLHFWHLGLCRKSGSASMNLFSCAQSWLLKSMFWLPSFSSSITLSTLFFSSLSAITWLLGIKEFFSRLIIPDSPIANCSSCGDSIFTSVYESINLHDFAFFVVFAA